MDEMVLGVTITHADRVLFGPMGITKLDLARYYALVADRMLPHIIDRPLVFVRCPSGIDGGCFYQKDVARGFPHAVRSMAIEHRGQVVHYALARDATDLIRFAQAGVLEVHAWGAVAGAIETPDRLIIDLDPGPGVAWDTLVRIALRTRDVVEGFGLVPFVKTSGGKGLHVVAPLQPSLDWRSVKRLGRAVAERVARDDPHCTLSPRTSRRAGVVFIDYLRSARGATTVAPYSPRARAGAPLSVPVRWEDVVEGLRSDAFRVQDEGALVARDDPWRGFEEAYRVPSHGAKGGTDAVARD